MVLADFASPPLPDREVRDSVGRSRRPVLVEDDEAPAAARALKGSKSQSSEASPSRLEDKYSQLLPPRAEWEEVEAITVCITEFS